MFTKISKEQIFIGPDCGPRVINLFWCTAGEYDQQHRYQETILSLCKQMREDESHEKDLYFLPLLDLVKRYLQTVQLLDMPEELEASIHFLNEIIADIEEKCNKKERVDIDFHRFADLLEGVIGWVESTQDAMDEAASNLSI